MGEMQTARQYAAAARLRRKPANAVEGPTAAEGWTPAFTTGSHPLPSTPPVRDGGRRSGEQAVPAYVGLTSISYAFARHR